MNFISKVSLGAVAALALSTPAFAQDMSDDTTNWTGPYIGGSLGYSFPTDKNDETIVFDTNRDGTFGDTVTTAAGANAFTPGFCSGKANGNSAAGGCRKDKDGTDWAVHAGYDMQFGSLVAGVVVEGGKNYVTDNVTAFSSTPASYVMSRTQKYNAALRARLGFATGGTLVYATGGGAYGKIRNSFATTNTFNTFTETNAKEDAWGWTAGGGIEQKVSKNFSVGLLYKYTRLNADGYRVNAGQGTPPSLVNPFVNPTTTAGSTDFARSSRFTTQAVSATASFRF